MGNFFGIEYPSEKLDMNAIGQAFIDGFIKGFESMAFLDVASLVREEKKARHRRRYFRMMERVRDAKAKATIRR